MRGPYLRISFQKRLNEKRTRHVGDGLAVAKQHVERLARRCLAVGVLPVRRVHDLFPRVAGLGVFDEVDSVVDVVVAEDAERRLHRHGAGAWQSEGEDAHGDCAALGRHGGGDPEGVCMYFQCPWGAKVEFDRHGNVCRKNISGLYMSCFKRVE